MNTSDAKAWSIYILYLSIIAYYISKTFFEDRLSKIFLDSLPSAMATIATLAASAYIALAVVQQSLKEDKRGRMKTVRDNTYSIIINNVSYIPIFIRSSIPCGLTEKENIKIKGINEIVIEKQNNFQDEGNIAYDSMLELIDILTEAKSRIIQKFEQSSDQEREKYINNVKVAYQDINYRFDIFRTSLMPRVLDFSENNELLDSMAFFEKAYLDYENYIRSPSIEISEQYFASLISILNSSANLYRLIIDDIEKN